MFSPDRRWIAYSARLSNQIFNGLFVEPFPTIGAKYQITDDDGHHPLWSRDGRELFFIMRPGRFAMVPVSTQPTFSFGPLVDIPRPFLTGGPAAVESRTYDRDPSGERLVGVVNAGEQLPSGGVNQIEVVLNWFSELKQRVPIR